MTWNYIYTCEMYKRDLLMQNVSRLCCFHFLWEFIWCVGIYRYVMGYNMCWIIFIFCYEIYFLFLLFFYLKWNKIIKLYFGNYNLLTCRGPHHPLVGPRLKAEWTYRISLVRASVRPSGTDYLGNRSLDCSEIFRDVPDKNFKKHSTAVFSEKISVPPENPCLR